MVRTLLVRGYKNFSREVEESARGTDAPADRLRRGVRVCLRHTIEGRLTLRNLICDAYADEPVVSEILQERNSHTRIMYGLMEDAWRREICAGMFLPPKYSWPSCPACSCPP